MNTLLFLIAVSVCFSLVLTVIYAVPSGPSVTVQGNTTKAVTNGTKINSSINTTISPGGYIFTVALTPTQQNLRWKGYVGNVTGTLTLDDANVQTLYSWTLTSVSGEVYATRASGTINWTGINCTWIGDGQANSTFGRLFSNRTIETNENQALSHISPDDNISATFTLTNHSAITVGSRTIGKNDCFAIQTYQNDAAQVFADSATANFTEIILYDGAFNKTSGNVIYATFMHQDIRGYRTDSIHDFQLILPENAAVGFTSSTPYYFYVELT